MDDEGGFIIYLGPRELGEAYEAHREVHYAPDLYPQHGAQYEEAHANARLLAASRDLLEAVEAMLFEHCGAKWTLTAYTQGTSTARWAARCASVSQSR